MVTPKQKRLKRRWENEALSGKRPKLKSRKWYVRELDKEFARIVRGQSAVCIWCLTFFTIPQETQCCGHILTRMHYSTRWDLDNARPCCFGCNIRMEHDALFMVKVIEYMKAKLGKEKFEALVRRHHNPKKFSRHDLADLLEAMKSGKDWSRLLESV